MAAQITLETYEILEAILLQLPLIDTMTAKAVYKYWNALIERSLALQTRLFLVGDRDACLNVDSTANKNLVYIDHAPVMQQGKIAIFPPFREVDWSTIADEQHLLAFSKTSNGSRRRYVLVITNALAEDLMLAPHTSTWRNMHPTLPPCTAICIWPCGAKDDGSDYRQGATIYDRSGVKLGRIIDMYAAMKSQRSAEGRGVTLGAQCTFYVMEHVTTVRSSDERQGRP